MPTIAELRQLYDTIETSVSATSKAIKSLLEKYARSSCTYINMEYMLMHRTFALLDPRINPRPTLTLHMGYHSSLFARTCCLHRYIKW